MDVETTKGELERLSGIEPTLSTAIAQILSDAFKVEAMELKGILERHLMLTVLLSAAVGLATGSIATIAFRQGPRDPRIFIVAEGLEVANPDEFVIELSLPRSFPMALINRDARIDCEDVRTDLEQVAAAALSRKFHGDRDNDEDYCE